MECDGRHRLDSDAWEVHLRVRARAGGAKKNKTWVDATLLTVAAPFSSMEEDTYLGMCHVI